MISHLSSSAEKNRSKHAIWFTAQKTGTLECAEKKRLDVERERHNGESQTYYFFVSVRQVEDY